MDQAHSSSGQLQVKAACAEELVVAEHGGCIPVMVSIKAPLSGMAAERPPVDLVLVLNVQKGRPAPVKWRMLLMKAVEVALEKLGNDDRFTVLADSRTRNAGTSQEEVDKELTQALYAKYGKEVNLMKVSDENCRKVQVSAVNKAIRSNTLVVTALELANSILHNREYEDKENRAAYVIVISNSDEQDIGSLLAWRFLSVHAFGFRHAHNARTMCAISSCRECIYALLDDERGEITQAFAACIDRITSAGAAMPIEIKLKCERKVELEAIDAPRISYFISSEKNAAMIWTSAHQAHNVPTKFIVYLKPKKGEEKLSRKALLKFFTVRAKYGHITNVRASESSDKVDGKVVPRSDKLEGKVMPQSDMVDGKVVRASNKLHGKVMAESESGNLDNKMMMESDKLDGKVVTESGKLDGKVVAETDKLDGKVVMDTNKPDEKVVMDSKKQGGDGMALAESDKLDGKVGQESDKLEGKVVMEPEKAMKLDKLDRNNVVPETDKLGRKVALGPNKLDMEVLAKPDKLVLKVKTIEHDGKVVLFKKDMEGYKEMVGEMVGEMVRIEAVKIVTNITENRNQLPLVNLAEKLRERWTTIQNSDYGKEAGEAGLISMLALEMEEMQIRLHSNYFWLEYMLSWQSHQRWQLPLPLLFMDKRDTQVDPPLQLDIFPKDRASPWANEYTVPRQLKVVVRVAAPGLNRCPVDLIAILDTSCGAEEKTQKRMRLLVKAMELVMTKLDQKDRLAIMHVQSPVTEPAPGTTFMTMSEQGRKETSAMLKSILVSKPPPAMANEKANQISQYWREQVSKVMKLVRKLSNIGSVNTSIRTLTSLERQSTPAVGQSVCGSSNLWMALEGAKEILVDRPPAEKEQRAGFIIVISDSNDDSILHKTPSKAETDSDYIVHAISFRDSGPCNTRAMNHIANSSNGIYAVLDDGQDQITDDFTACINKITSIVAVSTVVTIRCNGDSIIVLNNIQSAGQVLHSMDSDMKSVSISAGTFYAGTVRNFIAIVDKVGWYEYGMFYKFCTVDVTWQHPLSRKEERLHGKDFVTDTSDVFKEVESRLTVANTVTIITDPNLDKNLLFWRINLDKNRVKKLHSLFHEGSQEARDAGEALLAKEMEKLKDNLEKERVKMHENQSVGNVIDRTFIDELLAEPLSYMLSWLSRNF